LKEANEYLAMICEKLNRKPQSGNKNLSAGELLAIEKKYLLPAQAKFECARLAELRVDKYATIVIDNCHYSVPEQYPGKMISVKKYSSEIICFSENAKICSHQKSMTGGIGLLCSNITCKL